MKSSPPLPVTFCIDHLRADGAQRWLVQLASALKKNGFDVHVISLNDSVSPSIINALTSAEISVQIIGKKPLLCGIGVAKLAYTLFQRRKGPVISALFFSDIASAVLAAFLGIKYLIRAVRCENLDYGTIHWLLLKVTNPFRQAIVYVSEAARIYDETKGGTSRCLQHVVHNSIAACQTSQQETSRKLLRQQHMLSESHLVLGVLGRLEQQKNISIILHALKRTTSKNLAVLVAGDGSLLDDLRALASRLDLEQQVHFIGYHEKPLDFLSGIDVLVSASRFEGQPNALLEAISVGCPVVLSDIPGHRETVKLLLPETDHEALFFQDNSEESLEERLRTLPVNLPSLRDLSEKMRSQAPLFSPERMVSAWIDILSCSSPPQYMPSARRCG